MSKLKDQAGWIVRGNDRVSAALDDVGANQRVLQERVATTEAALAELQRTVDSLAAQVESLKEQLRHAVDDLGDRVGVLVMRADRVDGH